jgi:hypothetical protein
VLLQPTHLANHLLPHNAQGPDQCLRLCGVAFTQHRESVAFASEERGAIAYLSQKITPDPQQKLTKPVSASARPPTPKPAPRIRQSTPVHVAYDSVVSSLSEVGRDAALEVARTLDAEVIERLTAATAS